MDNEKKVDLSNMELMNISGAKQMGDEKNWGGNRSGAGRVAVIKRKHYSFYLSEDENIIDKKVSATFRQTEAELLKELAELLKCKQYEIADSVYEKMLSARKKITDIAIEAIKAEKDIIKKSILKERNQ